ncbi:MAG: sigma-70 family RNA polymerase sigma factor [Clostridia bacterium]|nr:sigma-70 family RNA polymerase sigma factor [Clostridia bacterium]
MIHETLTSHMDWLFRQALHLCGSTDEAEELTQETLLSALSSAAEPKDPQAWLATVLRRRHADMLRRKYRLPTVCIDCVPEPPAPAYDDADRESGAAAVRREVAFLAGRYREAVIRHYLHGEKVADVAAALGIPAGTVLSRLHAGRQ